MDPQLPAAAGYLVGVLEKIRNKCRLGYIWLWFVRFKRQRAASADDAKGRG